MSIKVKKIRIHGLKSFIIPVGILTSSYSASAADYFVKVNPLSSLTNLEIKNILSSSNLEVVHKFGFSSIYVARSKDDLTNSSLRKLESIQDVQYVEKVGMFYKHSIQYNPWVGLSDPLFDDQWAFLPALEGIYGINGEQAWDISTGSSEIAVCIIDSGIDYTHPDLFQNIWKNPGESGFDENGKNKSTNGIDDDQNGLVDDHMGWDFANNDNDPMDDDEHGTHVAGVVGAVGNNSLGVSGVNWDVDLIPIKMLRADGGGSYADGMKAIEYCVNLGARISNNSYGGGRPSAAFDELMDWVGSKNHLFVSSAGNSAGNNDTDPNYPASYPHDYIISVAASNLNGERAGFSNFGETSVDVAAPGEAILSTVLNGEYKNLDGTSMASPFVAGAAALYLSEHPETTVLELKDVIMNTAVKSKSLEGYAVSKGVLNLYNLIEKDNTPPARVENLEIDEISYTKLKVVFDETGDDGKKGRASYYKAFKVLDDGSLEDLNIEIITKESRRVTAIISGFDIAEQGSLIIVGFDNRNQRGKASNALTYKLKTPEIVHDFSGEGLNKIPLNKPWGIVGSGEKTRLTDSPGGPYDNHADYRLELPIFDANNNALVTFEMKHALEKRYDFFIVEAYDSKQEKYVELGRLSGYSTMKVYSFDLLGAKDTLTRENEKIQLRLRLTSDGYVNSDGVHIKSIKIYR